MKRVMIAISLCYGISMGVVADEAAPSVSVKRLALESANRIALGAIEACRKQGIQIGVTVVDRDGTVQAVMRDTIAAQITVPISRMKAFTAANFNAATSALKSRANTPIGQIDGLVMSAGGLPVQAGGQLLGAVGVSGAPSGETDEACAQAGIDTIIDDLEMEM
ncbi:MAG: heme-binding protein [Candidatus Thiodiazotropha sp. (ex Lucina aurantia)]|uniref:Adenosylcobalamin biosynthesis, GlcG-related protein n=1 Tax=Candidatus Thiodiazotropha endolucinida TaxID=1655433 RepID=A0A7Z0VNL8_9GAMM|nr:heme-binding protein [Candidatus Thiodiazotropha endolucinida]MBT3012105.1 heme-binding protein [Candidatus Thiodiazotropha sp. (ex Lucina pensylvanica)]MBT3014910.1 heme-binding protein [Candidatus Thiodiazotropha taylori]MBT3039124.1 heme-binding protein [Candidatus Thiodiazotropha sp. (ex Codakia orbicularis)]MBV2101900.1 heme-binding protein [Candidatus Thiodiazotropha sp. (ex Lucina aurantia)]MBT3022503.1 heme-binding protein [Candidatus Thiodiazotropha taylori]